MSLWFRGIGIALNQGFFGYGLCFSRLPRRWCTSTIVPSGKAFSVTFSFEPNAPPSRRDLLSLRRSLRLSRLSHGSFLNASNTPRLQAQYVLILSPASTSIPTVLLLQPSSLLRATGRIGRWDGWLVVESALEELVATGTVEVPVVGWAPEELVELLGATVREVEVFGSCAKLGPTTVAFQSCHAHTPHTWPESTTRKARLGRLHGSRFCRSCHQRMPFPFPVY